MCVPVCFVYQFSTCSYNIAPPDIRVCDCKTRTEMCVLQTSMYETLGFWRLMKPLFVHIQMVLGKN